MQRHPVPEPHNRTNSGAEQHSASAAHNPTVVYEIDGEVRWLDADAQRIVVHVADANGHAGGLRGQDVTFGIADARLRVEEDVDADGERDAADLLPGVRVRVRAHLPRALDAGLPEVLDAASVSTLGS